jgi:hypothetical protein
MANNDQNEFPMPVNGDEGKRRTARHLPTFFRTDQNKKFLGGTLDPLTQPGKLSRINAYVGRKDIPNYVSSDGYVDEQSTPRTYYQLEPAYVYQDPVTDEVGWHVDYIDYMNSLKYFGAPIGNHSKLNRQEAYTWDPHIDWDKFTNFREYYWLPNGPDPITIIGELESVISTYTVTLKQQGDNSTYQFSPSAIPDGLISNPRLTLYRGVTYKFLIDAPGKSFSIKTQAEASDSFFYNIGVDHQRVERGMITFEIPKEAPDLLYYIDNRDIKTVGMFDIKDITESVTLNVESEILDKRTYKSSTGVELVNGMKLKFAGQISPSKYANDFWYVEGVGLRIKLINYRDIETPAIYGSSLDVPFDDQPFDSLPWDNAANYSNEKDYIVINRASVDRNTWSRNNRWFNRSVIEKTALANNQIALLNQDQRANRPIIEFQSDLKLFQHGWKAKTDVDYADTITTDVFSEIEGELIGTFIDGNVIYPGQRVLFTADTDPLVNGKIYEVTSIFNASGAVKSDSIATQFEGAGLNNMLFKGSFSGVNSKTFYVQIDSVGTTVDKFKWSYDNFLTTEKRNIVITGGDQTLADGITVTFLTKNGHTLNNKWIGVAIPRNNSDRNQIALKAVSDSVPVEGEVVYVKRGVTNGGSSYYFQNGKWNLAQKKTKVNQAPLFDLFDQNKISYSDETVYQHNTFKGNRIFGYKIGTGKNDSVLGFPISHLNIDNVGDIEFEFDLETQTWSYQTDGTVVDVLSTGGFLRQYIYPTSFSFVNGWVRTIRDLDQHVVRVLEINSLTSLIPIDVFDNSGTLTDLKIRVYVNGKKVNTSNLSLQVIENLSFIKFSYNLSPGDKVVYKVRSGAKKNARGYYEIPLNWQNNPLNESVSNFTFGEVIDHVKSIIEDLPGFSGDFPGISNLANSGPLARYGRKFLQHAGSMPLAAFLMTDEHANVVKSLRWAASKYSEFKKEFLRLAITNPYDGTVSEIVDQILLDYSLAKHIDTSPFYFSDMSPFGACSTRRYVVSDPRLPVFVIDKIFNPANETRRSILLYVNDVQLVYGVEYTFDTTDAFVNISSNLLVDDVIVIKDYETTDGSYMPFTPSKLGIYPTYVPTIYLDDTYMTTIPVIQGHDGSIIKAYNDYRDDLILELEKRIYNTCRVKYDPNLFNIDSVIGSYYFRGNDFTKTEIDGLMLVDFLRWNSVIDQDFITNDYHIDEEPFTYNYNNSVAPNNIDSLPGYWRGVYKYFFDTDRPHTHPWEMQGFTIKPTWWDTVYGVAPYTSENKILWDSIEAGLINDPAYKRTSVRYKRPGLRDYLPVDAKGKLVSPYDSNLVQGFALINAKGSYNFGDYAPVETAWRKSSEYPYSVMVSICILRGSEFIAKMWDRFRTGINLAGQVYYKPTNKRLRVSDLVFSDSITDTVTGDRAHTSGLANFVEEYVFMEKYKNAELYKTRLTGLQAKLSYRIGGYTSKEKMKVLLDSRSPNASGSVILPVENYHVFYNKSFPVTTVNYSGVLIEKLGTQYKQWQSGKAYKKNDRVIYQKDLYRCETAHTSDNSPRDSLDNTRDISVQRFEKNSKNWIRESIYRSGFKVRGYDNERNYFEIFPAIPSNGDPSFNVGGISESFVEWTGNTAGDTTLTQRQQTAIFRGESSDTASGKKYYAKGTIARVDFRSYYRAIQGHTASSNFEYDVDKWQLLPRLPIVGGSTAIRRSRFEDTVTRVPYSTIFPDIQAVVDFLLGYQKRLEELGFEFDDYNKDLSTPLDWLTSAKEFMFWTLQNWATGAIITLSPSASLLKFKSPIVASVDSFSSDFYNYSIFKSDGTLLKADLTDVIREDVGFTIKPSGETNDGIFHIRANLVQREHVLLLDNKTIFNDIIYDQVPGYRQGRVKLIGFKTTGWDGGFTSPGFVFDEAKITTWIPNTDYALGSVVRYKNYHFTATSKILSKSNFDYTDWKQSTTPPTTKLIPNFDYQVEQFRDFYSLDASIYNPQQQKLARHLVGYQDRAYLDNIIVDDVSQYKFYQGFIKEKGTMNSVTKLFDALRSSGFSTVDIKEEWAFKLGDYGASDAFIELEFPLDEQEFRYNPQDIVLTKNKTDFIDLSIYNVTSGMLTVKPSNYDSNPFTKIKLDHDQTDYGIFKYQVAGYVRDEDVDHIIFNEAALMNYDINYFKDGDKIWLGYTSNNDWNVLTFVNLKTSITTWSITGNIISLECSKIPDVAKDDIVTIRNLDSVDGTYKVQAVYNHIVEIFTFNTALYHLQEDSTHGLLYKMEKARYKDTSEISYRQFTKSKIRGEKLWIDKNKFNQWAVLENKDSFTESELEAPVNLTAVDGQKLGNYTKISSDNKWMFVGVPYNEGGKVLVYNRPNTVSTWKLIQILTMPTGFSLYLTASEKFGSSFDISSDGSILAICAPYATVFKSRYKGDFNINSSYTTGDLVKYDNKIWENVFPVTGDGSTITVDSFHWEESIIEGDRTGAFTNASINHGAVVVYRFNETKYEFIRETIILSNDLRDNEYFGSKVRLASDGTNTWLYVSSKEFNNNAGRLQVFKNDLKTLIVSKTTSNEKSLTVSSTSGLEKGMKISFLGDQLGGLSLYREYYIHSVISSTELSITDIKQGSILSLTDSVGTMTMKVGGWKHNAQRFVDFTNISSGLLTGDLPVPGVTQLVRYAFDFDVTSDASRIAVSAPYTDEGAVYIFQKTASDTFQLIEIIDALNFTGGKVAINEKLGGNGYLNISDRFGWSLAITNTSLFVSCPEDDYTGDNVGTVYQFDVPETNNPNNLYRLRQILVPPLTLDNERFGMTISLSPSKDVLAVSSKGSNVLELTFDVHIDRLSFTDDSTQNYELDTKSKKNSYSTTFDAASTLFYDKTATTGSVYIFNKFDDDYIYGDKLNPSGDLVSHDDFGESVSVSNNTVIVGTPNRHSGSKQVGTVFIFDYSVLSWAVNATQDSLIDINKIKKAFIYNNTSNKLISNLDFIDPAKGKIANQAEKEITYQTYYDPAVYQYGVPSSVTVDDSNPWTDEHVGEVWWDLSRFKYTWYEQGDSTYRNNNWGRLFPGSTINVYEWVESPYLPSRWAMLADTEQGLALGISGIPREIDDFTYSSKSKFDSVSGNRINTYYFWVKNKTTIPKNSNRNISCADVARLIFDPSAQGLRFIAVTDTNSISMNNVTTKLVDQDVSLNMQFYVIDNVDLETHRQYALIAVDDVNAVIPKILENKWFDSLVGYDKLDQRVPDITLNKRQKYGTLNSPRQSWFMNRFEALKQLFEYINSKLAERSIVDDVSLSSLKSADPEPTIGSGEIDKTIDILEELRFIGITKLKTAALTADVIDGKIQTVNIVDPGFGYGTNKSYEHDIYGNPIKWYGPSVTIIGTGEGALIQTVVDSQGKIVNVNIIRRGFDYDQDSLKLIVRDFTVLVKTDSEARNGWSLHCWHDNKEKWLRVKTQSYDVTRYWSYKDWYATGYTVNTDINYLVESTYQIGDLEAKIGEIVKINNVGYGDWLLLERRYNSNSADYTDDYVVVGRESATIEFSSKIYNLNQELGFDTNYGYSSDLFDQGPRVELRIILEALRDNILIDDLRIEYIRSFFNSVYYVLSEQTFVDWAFKTSFLKINHNVGTLKQRITFQSDVLDSYQSFIEEAKPYKSKIREFVSSYQGLDNAGQMISDFDLPSYYNSTYGRIETVNANSPEVVSYPWKNWLDNHTYQITEIVIADSGKNYTSAPKVIITGGFTDPNKTASSSNSSTIMDAASSSTELGRSISVISNWYITKGTITFIGTGLPYHSYGNPDTMNNPKAQDLTLEMPLRAGTNDPSGAPYNTGYGRIGVWLNGVAMYNPSAGNGTPDGFKPAPYGFNYNAAFSVALSMGYSFGEDEAGGHASPDGVYHYHDFTFGDAWVSGNGNSPGSVFNTGKSDASLIPYLNGSLTHADGHSKILGWTIDGYPVYGPYGYDTPSNSSSKVRRMKSGYEMKPTSSRLGVEGASNLEDFPMGIFVQDYEYNGVGDLDTCNGRYCVTPDYPNGTYAYFVTLLTFVDGNGEYLSDAPAYPYVVGNTFYGIPVQPGVNILPGKGIAPVSVPMISLTELANRTSELSATATAYISQGKVYKIVIDYPGKGYIGTPTIFLSGGNGDVEADRATAYAVIGNTKARTNLIGIKFDRYTMSYTVDDYRHIDRLNGNNVTTSFKLTYAPEFEKKDIIVKVNDIELYQSQYELVFNKVSHGSYKALEGSIVFDNAPSKGTGNIVVSYKKNISLYPAADRIGYAYNPTVGQYGTDLGQLMTGIDYGGVTVSSIDFDVSGGWDIVNWDNGSWDNVLDTNNDCVYISDGTTLEFVLPYIPNDGEVINVYYDNVRIDDPEYDGITILENKNAVMESFVGDGSTILVTIPAEVDPQPGKMIILRKSTSDGSLLPTDRSAMDTFIAGGDFAYSSARGVAADEIVIDGDGLITPDTSHGPEELVQGQVIDTLDINVYHAPSAGGPKVVVQNFIGNGVINTFDLDQVPVTADGLTVIVDGTVVDSTIDFLNGTVTLINTPAVDSKVVLISIDTSGYDIMDKEEFVGDGSTKEFLTAARFSNGDVTVFATVDGIAASTSIKASDGAYETFNNVVVVFNDVPEANSLVQIMVFRGDIQKCSEVNTQVITLVTDVFDYTLTNPPAGVGLTPLTGIGPASSAVFVRADNDFLRAPDYQNFVYDGSNSLAISSTRYKLNSLKRSDINVYKNRESMVSGKDYAWDSSRNYIRLTDSSLVVGDELIVEIIKENDFIVEGNQIKINSRYNLTGKKTLKVTTFTDHSIVKVKRTEKTFTFDTGYDLVTYDAVKYDIMNPAINRGGILDLPRTVSNNSGVFVAFNKKLLSPNIDYVVLDNKKQIKVIIPQDLTSSDYIDIITTNDQTINPSYGYKIFKDMVNRTHYKILDKKKTTVLANELRYFDTRITVEDGSTLDEPGVIPGVVEIAGERIEYYAKNGNQLSRLRRSTLGTGINTTVKIGTKVMNIGQKTTIPYTDKEYKALHTSDGSTHVFDLDITPVARSSAFTYKDTIPAGYYPCDEIEVFVAGRRLRKDPIKVYDQTLGQDSYKGIGDRWLEAEFSVDGSSKSVRLTLIPDAGAKIVVLRKQGKIWQKYNEGVSLRFSDTDVARFVTAWTVDLPK